MFLLQYLCISEVKWAEVAQSCPTFCDPVDCSLLGSSVHRIFQARILEWGAISFSRESSRSRDWNAGGGRLKRVGIYINISHYDWLTLMYGREHHNIVRQLSSNFKNIYRERQAGGGCRWDQPVWVSLWRKRDPVHWRQQSWLEQFLIQWKPTVGFSPD